MIEQDTIRLLRECDSGIQMGISAIDDVLIESTMTHSEECSTSAWQSTKS